VQLLHVTKKVISFLKYKVKEKNEVGALNLIE